MMQILQKLLIQFILQPLSGLMQKIPEKIRDTVFVSSGLMIFLVYFLKNSGVLSSRFLYIFVIDVVFCGLMLLCSLPQKLEPIRFDLWLLIPWLGLGGFMLLSGITESVDYLPDALLLVVMFPVFFIVWNNGDMKKHLRQLLKISKYSFIIFFSVSILFFPLQGIKYKGFFTNENGAAFYLALVSCCIALEILACRKINWAYFGNLILLGISAAMVYYTNSRTGQLALLLAIPLTVVLYLAIQPKACVKILCLKAAPMLLSVIVFMTATLYIITLPQTVIQMAGNLFQQKPPVVSTQPSDPSQSQPSDPSQSQPSLPSNPSEPTSPIKPGDMLNQIQDYNDLKTDTTDKTLDQMSTGRVSIWKAHLAHVTFLGHPMSETFQFIGKWGKEVTRSTAHNTILEFAYRHGALAGVFFLLFNLLAGIKSIVYAFKHRDEEYALMPFAVSVTFGVMSLLSSFAVVFYYMIAMYYYFVQAPLMKKEPVQK